MTKRFAANRAELRRYVLCTDPTAPLFTFWIDTLNCGARHQRHNALPRVAALELPSSVRSSLSNAEADAELLL